MSYLRIAPEADDRRGKEATAPIVLTNCVLKRTPATAPQMARGAAFFLAPTPGRTLRATLSDNLRGLFSEPGCRSGNLFIPNGSVLSEMTSSLSYTDVGALSGGDVVTMRADRSDLAVRSFGELYNYDGSSFTNVADTDAPEFAQTLAIVARRWVAALQDNDLFAWSVAGDYSDWRANNQAQDQDRPDPIVGQEEIGGDLWSFNSRSAQIWQATGGAEEVAFAPVPGVNVKIGLASREAFCKIGSGGMMLGHNRVVHGTRGYDLAPVPNLALESALKSLTPAQFGQSIAWSYQDGSKEFAGFNAPGLDRAYVFDVDTQLWHERKRYSEDEYDIDFAATAFNRTFVGSRNSMKLWSLDDDVYIDGYDDDGDAIPLVREFSVAIPSGGDVPVDRIVFDMATRDVPLIGQGSAPKMSVRYSNDGGQTWDTWRDVDLPTLSSRIKPMDWGMPMATAENGLIVQGRISDPIGFALYGVWVNPSEQEYNS